MLTLEGATRAACLPLLAQTETLSFIIFFLGGRLGDALFARVSTYSQLVMVKTISYNLNSLLFLNEKIDVAIFS